MKFFVTFLTVVQLFIGLDNSKAQFFTVVKEGPRYWLKDSQGQRFFSTGLNCVLPKDGSVRPHFPGYDLARLPGYTPEKWAAQAVLRLRDWGFNTVGGWSDDSVCQAGLPFCVVLEASGHEGLIRVFDPDFQDFVRARIAKTLSRWKGVRNLIGYFTDNELPWGNPIGWGGAGGRPLLFRFMELDQDAPGKKALVSFMEKRYGGDFAAFQKTWSSPASSFQDLAGQKLWQPRAPAAAGDIEAWAGDVAGAYGRQVSLLLKELDGDHLNLGVRFAGAAPEPVLKALGPYSDVVSVNYYRRGGPVSYKHLERIHELSGGKPLILSEFSWRAQRNRSGLRNSRGANVSVADQGERADRCRKYLESLLPLPFVVGYHFFMLFDESPGGRSFDGEDSNYGLVDLRDREYAELAAVFREMNPKAQARHAASLPLPSSLSRAKIKEMASPRITSTLGIWGRNQAPVTLPFFWGDGAAGAQAVTLSPALDTKAFFGSQLKTGFGTGCGWGFPLSLDKEPAFDLSGAKKLYFEAKLDLGRAFRIFLEESGVDHPGAENFQGDAGADGESWSGPEFFGSGSWMDYELDMTQMESRDSYGNPAGAEELDLQALDWLDFYFPPNQGGAEFWLGEVKAAP